MSDASHLTPAEKQRIDDKREGFIDESIAYVTPEEAEESAARLFPYPPELEESEAPTDPPTPHGDQP